MADIFRKTSLEKLSSPEQLDKMIVITPPSFWIALSGAGLIIAAALIWSILGRLPVNVETHGIYLNNGGTYSVYSEVAGIAEQVVVQEGDMIEKGDVIAYLNEDDVQQKIEDYENRIESVEKITMDSESDVITADNKPLIDIKGQLLTLDQNLRQNQALLNLQVENVAVQRQKATAAEKAMREAEAAYFNSLNTIDTNGAQLAYSEAQSQLANASGYLEAAYSSLDQANVNVSQADSQYQSILSSYNKLKEQGKILEAKKNSLAEEIQRLNPGFDPSRPDTWAGISEEPEETEDSGRLLELIDAWQQAQNEYDNWLSSKEQLKLSVNEAEAALNASKAARDNYQDDVNHFSSEKDEASGYYEASKADYLNRLGQQAQAQREQSKLSNEYNLALNDYTTEQAKLTSLLDNVAQMEVQVESDKEMLEKQTKTVYGQFEATKASVIDQLTMECDQYRDQLEKCAIVSTVSGKVSNVAVVQGSAINQGSELIKVQQGGEGSNVVVCYVTLDSGKKVEEGMEVLIYPTTVNKQEYGHMEATVETVDEFVASTENLRTQLGNDNLVEVFLKDGPVVAVVCRLKEDASTSSGYYWSSSKGKDLMLTEGTLVEASVVLEEKAPITMLIPYIKEKLTMQTGK